MTRLITCWESTHCAVEAFTHGSSTHLTLPNEASHLDAAQLKSLAHISDGNTYLPPN